MSEAPKPNVGTELVRIHRVITRGLQVSIAYSQSFAAEGYPDAATQEGFATYVASLVTPGLAEEEYFYVPRETYEKNLNWIGEHREKILEDSARSLTIGGTLHRFYFGWSRSEYPTVGYMAGYQYIRHLHQTYTLQELLTFGTTEQNAVEFENFWRESGE